MNAFTHPTRATVLAGLLMMAVVTGSAGAAEQTYLALGDSVAWGFTRLEDAVPCYGDQGYVAPYADWLATQYGERPNVINLGIPQETSDSFFTGGMLGTLLNLNYTDFESQASVLAERIATEHAAGRSIEKVSFALGANDLIDLISSDDFLGADTDTQLQLVIAELDDIAVNYTSVLTQLQTDVPEADLLLLGYYNPYAAVPDHPFYDYSSLILGGLNAVITDRAMAFDAEYIDLASVFDGHEAEWTYMLDEPVGTNIHPTPTGYAMIAQAMIPEPAAGLLLTIALTIAKTRRFL